MKVRDNAIKHFLFFLYSMNDDHLENDTTNLMTRKKTMPMSHQLQPTDLPKRKANLKIPVTKGDLPVMILMKPRKSDPNGNISQEIYSQTLYSKWVPSRQKTLH